MTNEILTIREASDLIAARKLSPVELTRACLDRIARHDGALNSFLHLTAAEAMTAARTAEAAVMTGRSKGRLHGIPIAFKDIFETKGIPTTAHSRLLESNVPEQDATCVRCLSNAGAIMLGKLALHEFAFSGPSWDLPWPPARNPWNPDHQTGGSSSGAAVAIAAGMVLGAMGSDTGGSIRSPAAYCGIAGLKPTYGRVSRAGVLPLAFSLDHVGPMAWTVEDCAILLGAIAGYDSKDPGSADRPVPNFRDGIDRSIKGIKVGIVRQFHEVDIPVSDGTLRGIQNAIKVLEDAGADVREVRLSPLIEWRAVGLLIMLVEGFTAHEQWMQMRLREYGELLRDRLSLGGLISGADYLQAQRRRRELCNELANAMSDLDVLLTAAVVSEAPRLGVVPKWAMFDRPNFASPFNVSGYPAMSVCTGYGADGLPVAMQLIAKPFDEATLFRVGHRYELATRGLRRRPNMVLAN